ncbi:MAG TPA: multiheme c-type cytochrome [Pirellulales bacterium]|nr:multiheme c-type cytochrome [Pirellulales bacterium]
MKSFLLSRLLPAALLCLAAAALALVIFRGGSTAHAQPAGDSPTVPSAANHWQRPASLEPTLFADWPRPKVALVLTGLLQGYIEPCGCSGKENEQGGLSRRDRLLTDLAAQNWTVVALDVGDQVRRFGRQQEIKFQAVADALKTMGYRAVGLGPNDLRLSATELLASVAPVGNQPSPFVSTNAALFAFDPKTLPLDQVIEAGGLKIGVLSVLGDEQRSQVNNQDLQFQPADKAIADGLPKLTAAKCDFLVLLASATQDESIALAKKYPQFQIVVSAGGAEVPPKQATVIEGTATRLIELGSKGMYAIVLGLYDNSPDSIRYQRVPLDARFGDSARMKRVLASYQDQLKDIGLEGLGLKPAAYPGGRKFVGSQACSECHTQAYAVWKKTPHAQALETLAHLDPPRQSDPECLSCHVTGWEPQKFFPWDGGYLSLDKTPALAGNGCENCHGPASNHVAAETFQIKASEADKERYRAELRLSLKSDADRRKVIDICLKCHDIDNSINFKGGDAFDQYWPKVEHHGKD